MTSFKSNIPTGKSGDWAVEKFNVTPEGAKFANLRAMLKGRGMIEPGNYTRLTRRGEIIMSDVPDELRDLAWPVNEVKQRGGRVLVNGLGLGLFVQMITPFARLILVVEKSPDVIALVSPFLPDNVQVVQADAFTYMPPVGDRYTVVWHDIWDGLCSDNLPEMKRLHRRYGRRADWQGSWGREWCER